jgi:hypothetical protein
MNSYIEYGNLSSLQWARENGRVIERAKAFLLLPKVAISLLSNGQERMDVLGR